jgi:sugar O-acyltransferase (sialic acid O-acetyltransferase NeuD family)
MIKKIILAGNAITANIMYEYLAKDSRYQVVAATVDDAFLDKGGINEIDSVPLSRLCHSHPPSEHAIIMAMGYNNLNRDRESMFHRLKKLGYTMESYIHPKATVHTPEHLAEGCVVLPSAVIEPHAQVDANTMIWANVTVAHHATTAAHCWLASGVVISGQAAVKRNSFVGVNATIVNEITVNEYNIIGAGALISKNTKPWGVYLARSAEELRYSSEEYLQFSTPRHEITEAE